MTLGLFFVGEGAHTREGARTRTRILRSSPGTEAPPLSGNPGDVTSKVMTTTTTATTLSGIFPGTNATR